MNELKVRSMLKQIKSDDPDKRFEGLDLLYEFKEEENEKIRLELLLEMIEAAAHNFPKSVDKWDNPSFYLIDFVCDYPMPEVIDHLIKHFDSFSPAAQIRAVELFLLTEDEEIFFEIEEKLARLINEEEVHLPVEQLVNFPVFVRNILNKTINRIHTPHYKFMMYDMIHSVTESGVEWEYKKEIVLPILLTDYETTRREYLSYDKEYSAKFVYTAWKEEYISIRFHMGLLLQLMNYYYTLECEEYLSEAVRFKDPLIAEKAVIVSLIKHVKVEEEVLLQLAENLESAEDFYWDLKGSNKENLYPIKDKKQPIIAKSKLFTHLVYMQDEEDERLLGKFPEHINVLDSIDTENQYGQPVRYYLLSFKESGTDYVGWAGGFSLEDGDDTAHVWEGTYTDFVELDAKSIEQHKDEFFAKREDTKKQLHDEIHFESSPKLSKGMWFFYAILLSDWTTTFMDGIDDGIYFSIGFTVIGLILTVLEFWKIKRSKVLIVGHDLVVQKGSKTNVIQIQDIKKVKYNKKRIFVFNKKNEEQLVIPMKWVDYDHFAYVLMEQTEHLRDRPFIEE
ncbi:hypothetical protein QUF49_14885 [Fictibacillus sp. b24]|uniref:hypothetical protein n=1 Tax=Fictibacillus sp. b24 TaxID=3055863 RepID=UPI0025A0CA21|nr:hypothetical protein [Fictibacillus sp. b24]MDM5317293.1 hypothetical protein [Fictibacillus sp. b24]